MENLESDIKSGLFTCVDLTIKYNKTRHFINKYATSLSIILPKAKQSLPEPCKEDCRSLQFNSTQLAAKYNVSIKRIGDFCFYNKIKLPKRINASVAFFAEQHADMAYVTGWLSADGCVGDDDKITLLLAQTDRPMICNIVKLIGYTGSISDSSVFDGRTNKTYYRSSISFRSSEIASMLAQFGVVPRKSLTLQYHGNVFHNDELRRHFIRG